MKPFFYQSCRYLALLAVLLLCVCPTWAGDDGPPSSTQGSFGVNRRIESADGYGAISGTFSEPSIPAGKAGDDLMGNNNGTEPDISLPNPYLGGGSSGVRVDAGLKYECRAKYVNVDKPVGWTVFLQYAKQVPDPAHPDQKKWIPDAKNGYGADGKEVRIPKGQLGSCNISYRVNPDGSAEVEVDAGQKGILSTIPYSGAFSVDADTANHMFVKSVTSITQTGEYKLTDAFMDGCNFSLGSLTPISVSNGQFVLHPLSFGPNGPLQDWGYASLGTGYSPTDFDGTTDSHGKHNRFVVDFSYPSYAKRNADGSDPLPTGPSRYLSETVNLSLRKGSANPKGKKAKLGKSGGAGGV